MCARRLVSAVFRLSELEKQMGEAKLAHVMSPTLSSTVAWFLQTWANPYLLVPENLLYPEVRLNFISRPFVIVLKHNIPRFLYAGVRFGFGVRPTFGV
jgi:hypothetical protein